MAAYDLEEQEQLESIKAWWKQYGNLITYVVLVVSVAVLAFQAWNWYQRSQSAKAAAVFEALQRSIGAHDTQREKAAIGELVQNFSGTPYASLGAMQAARSAADAGDLKTAQTQLQWVAEHGKDELKDIARLRLVGTLLDQKAYDEALKQLDATPGAAFAGRYAEAKGDVLAAQGKVGEARSAYQTALSKLEEGAKSGNESAQQAQIAGTAKQLLQQKLDALGEGK